MWFDINILTLNLSKTKYTVFGNSKECCSVAIDNNNIDKIESIKFLCVMLDSKQTWNYHIQLITKTFSRSMAIIYRVKGGLHPYKRFALTHDPNNRRPNCNLLHVI